jgi:tetrapyrrole methylase family protein/MazG family protein
MIEWQDREHYTAEDLVALIRILRDPQTGCPWDRVQTHGSIRKNFLEEAYEAVEAIDADDTAMLREELGDVLMQVVFHAVIEEERGRSNFEQVCRAVCEKLVNRHPHLFASSAAENRGINGWEALKNKEKGRRTLQDELDTVPTVLPALMRAQKMQKRAAGYHLGAQTPWEAAQQLQAACERWQQVSASGTPDDEEAPDPAMAEQAAGELLWAAAASMRLAGVDAEQALTFAADRMHRQMVGTLSRSIVNGEQTQFYAPAPIKEEPQEN